MHRFQCSNLVFYYAVDISKNMMVPNVILSVMLLIIISLHTSEGMKHYLHIQDDTRAMFMIETFGFEEGGVIDINIHKMSIKNHKEGDKTGFVFRKAESESAAQSDLEQMLEDGRCIFDKKEVADAAADQKNNPDEHSFYFELTPNDWKSYQKKMTLEGGQEGMYSLIFANCPGIGMGADRKTNFRLEVDLYNPGPNYLSAGDRQLPSIYFGFFCVFSIALLAWVYVLKQPVAVRGPVHSIHILMLALLALKVVCLFFEAVRWHMMAQEGHPGIWSVMFYVLSTLKGIMLFTVIMLIGSGWSLLKSYLNDNEKKIILMVLTLQVIDHVAIVYLEEVAPGSQQWLTWRDLLHLVDIICCCSILFPIIWSIKRLREEAEADRHLQQNIPRLKLFRTFYVAVVIYIYLTRIVVFLVASTVSFQYMWVPTFITEMSSLAFYIFTGVCFRPSVDAVYLPAPKGEENSEYGLEGAMSRSGVQDPDLEMTALLPAARAPPSASSK